VSVDNFGSEGAREMDLGENERWGQAPHNARVKSKNRQLIPKSAANLSECDLLNL
jgi:hypothetical protein